MVDRLSADEITKQLENVPDWARHDAREAISKTFQFKNFLAAFEFMSQVAPVAESLNHHPEWFNVYRTVEVTLATHDVGGLSELDFKLAQEMDRLEAEIKGA